MSKKMVGRLVRTFYGEIGTVVKWEPLGPALTDTLVEYEDSKRLCWHASHSLQPFDDLGPLPSRRMAQAEATAKAVASLRIIRESLVANWHDRWPGAEHGKAIIGNCLNSAIESLEKKTNV